MAILRSLVGGAVATLAHVACYTPELRDCAVRCANVDDCAPDQVCGTDSYCAAPAVAGSCRGSIEGDGGVDGGRPIDAPPNDAPPMGTLAIKISGRGRVVVEGSGLCDHPAPGQDCAFAVQLGVMKRLTAIGDADTELDKWTSIACAGQDETCEVTPMQLTTYVHAKFRTTDHDD